MRTTVTLDDDVAREVERLRREQSLGVSAAINALARRGMRGEETEITAFEQTVSSLGTPRIPIDDVGEALEVLEGDAHR
jgi:hypothetical protein